MRRTRSLGRWMKDESEDNLTWWYLTAHIDKKLVMVVVVVVKLFRET